MNINQTRCISPFAADIEKANHRLGFVDSIAREGLSNLLDRLKTAYLDERCKGCPRDCKVGAAEGARIVYCLHHVPLDKAYSSVV